MEQPEDRLIAAASRVAKADREAWRKFMSTFQELTSLYYARAITSNAPDLAEFGRLQGYARLCTKLSDIFALALSEKEKPNG